MYSPDGKLIAYRGYGENETFQLFVVPADGSADPRALTEVTPGGASHEFSPDGTKVMLNQFGSETLLIDVESGEATTLPDTIDAPATWQRQAP
jgi:Tol biopolymer transport system component